MKRRARSLALLLCAAIAVAALAAPLRPVLAAPAEGFASPQIRAIWQRDDGPVAAQSVSRSWMWGPGAFYTDYEPYSDAPNGNHLVQYFDKGRLEINDPNGDTGSPWFVTSGLLVKELVAGKVQTGNDSWHNIGPARVPVAGDGNATGVATYANFASLTGRAPDRTGQPLPGNSYLRPNGNDAEVVGGLNPPTQITLPRYETASGHNWADVFWSYVNSSQMPAGFNWLYTLGYPITEPYWIIVPINGKRQTILVQLFERRTLTFNPSNPPASQVEMGNVGRHYYDWRYGAAQTADLGATYNVNIGVGPAPTRMVTLDEKLAFTNNTGSTLNRAVLRVSWNYWPGVFSLLTAKVGGKDATTSWLETDNLGIDLPQPVPRGGEVSIVLTARLKPRPVGGRTGYDRTNDVLALGDMLPTLVPWQNGGWQYYPYSDLGDLGDDATANYAITIASTDAEALVVGGTGKITSRSKNGSVWQFNAPNVRDVGYVVSPNFINPLADASMTAQVGGVKILDYFLQGHKADGQRQLQLVAPAFGWYSQHIGAYPFDTYTIAEMGVPLEATDNYAQEYPMAYFVPTSWLKLGTSPGTWEWYTPFHEVGHQWFYSTVGNNQLIDPWLDEAMTTYITTEYIRASFPNEYATSWVSMTAHATSARPVSAGVYSGFASENQYSYSIYDSGTVMLGKVRQAMGDADFYAALQDYYNTYKLKRVRPADLTAIFQKHSNADLQGIFSAYLANF